MSNTTTKRTAKTTPAKPAPAKATSPAKVPAPKPVPSNCHCGCGRPTVTAKAIFIAGHDARLAGVLGRALATEDGLTAEQQVQYDGLSDKLRAKADKVVETIRNREQAKAAKIAAKALAQAAYEQALGDALVK